VRERVADRGCGARLTGAVLAVLVTAALAPAAPFGDIEVTVKSEPHGTALHGYAEIEFLVNNRSAQSAHEVRITYPRSSYGLGGDYLRSASRSVTVEPGKTARVVISYPERLDTNGSDATVAIDGREQDRGIEFGSRSGSRSRSGYARRGNPELLALFSKSVDTRFPDWLNSAERALQREGKYISVEPVRAEHPVDQWSTSWLGYSRYDGVTVTADDLRVMPPEVKSALGQYVECGGSLLVLGRDPPLPGPWKPRVDQRWTKLLLAEPGFGHCLVTDRTNLSEEPALLLALESWAETARPWRVRGPNEANRVFSVVEDVGIPVRGLLLLMFVFAVVIGPVNLVVLARKKRKLWLFWTVPLISFLTCLIVLGYMALSEGWQGRSRVEGFTVLDENSRRASSLGWTGFYTPLLPGGGLHFGSDTEVIYQNGDDPYSSSYSYRARASSGSGLTIDWTREQHLTSGWLTPRVPAHFALRKSELRRERVTIAPGPAGPEAVNGLGADLVEFWYSDGTGNLFHAKGKIPAGDRAALAPMRRSEGGSEVKPLREVFTGDWHTLPDKVKTRAPVLLAPNTYLGVLEGAPFLDDGLPGASVRKARSAVYGILAQEKQ
jgi:hypothetical protein